MSAVDYSKLDDAISKLETLASKAKQIGDSLTSEVIELSDADLSNVKQKFTDAATKLTSAKGQLSSKKAELQAKEASILG